MNRSIKRVTDLPRVDRLIKSSNPRAPRANITNARELFGDIDDDDDIDAADGGNLINDDLVSLYGVLSGDVDEGDLYGDTDGDLYGDVKRSGSQRGRKPMSKRTRNALIASGIGVAALGGGAAALIARRKARERAMYQNQLQSLSNAQTVTRQRLFRGKAGVIKTDQKIPFFNMIGAIINQSPIDATEGFPGGMMRYMLDRQAAETPFQQETCIGTYNGTLWTATTTSVGVFSRFFFPLVVQIGINSLNAVPGTVMYLATPSAGTTGIPTLAGLLTIGVTTNPFVITIQDKFNVRFVFYPWQLVQNRPLPVLGQYTNAVPISMVLQGPPAASAFTLVVPGSLHPWVIALRNSIAIK